MPETIHAPAPDIERAYNRFQERTPDLDTFIRQSSRLLNSPHEALQLAQHMTTIACATPSKQAERIADMMDVIHPSEALRRAILKAAGQLRNPPAQHAAAAALLAPPAAYFLAPLDQPGNPALPGKAVLRQVRQAVTEMHRNYVRSIAASMVNYSIMDQTERPQFIRDIKIHLERRNEAFHNTVVTCRAVMHMRYRNQPEMELVRVWQEAEKQTTPQPGSHDRRRPPRRKDIIAQMNVFAASGLADQCRKASQAAGSAKREHIAAANFWRQVQLNLPAR